MDYHYADLCAPSEDIVNNHYTPDFDVFAVNGVNAEYQELGTVLSDGGDIYGASAVVFDKNEELFWSGNQGGHVTSYYGPTMQKYTSFQVHASEEVRALMTIEEGILALTKTTLRHQIRRGIPKFTHKSSNMVDMQCILPLESNRFIMGGHQDTLIDFDITRLEETKQHSLGDPTARCAILRKQSYMLVAGDPCGRISLRDPNTLRAEHILDTHSGSLSDLDVQGNLIVTCGFSMNQGALACDCFLLVYDVRALRPLPPLALCCEPLLLRFLPAVSSRLAAVTAHGRVQLLDMHTPDAKLTMFQVNTQNSQCVSFDVASTSQAFVFGDQSGHVHLFSPEHNTEPVFNNFSRGTEFPDTPEEFPFVNYTDESFPLSSIPLPPLPTGNKWMSDWPEQFTKPSYRTLRLIDPEILKSIKMQGPIGYAPNPGSFLRNQMPYVIEQPLSPSHGKSLDAHNISNLVEGDGNSFVAIPKRYRKVEIRYSKLGSNDFDFEQYNKSGLPGLEATLPNSYCNAMLQVLYYTAPVKRALLRHTCSKEFCLSCELGFLFRMLDTSMGAPCQASNFLRAFRTVPEASALGLILTDRSARSKTNLAALIQSWNRFILHQMHYEILETRRREMEALAQGQDFQISSNVDSLSINSYHPDPYREEFLFDESEFPSIDLESEQGKSWRKRREAEERDRISLMMAQDEGKYMWLSPSALAASGDHADGIDYEGESYRYSSDSALGVASHSSQVYGGLEDLMDENGESLGALADGLDIDDNVKRNSGEETEVSRLFGTKQLQVHRCLKCSREEHKESIVLLCNLQYPSQLPVEPINFTDVLRMSLCPRKTTPAWCEGCSKFSPTLQCCSVRQLPHLLAVNCGLATPADRDFWQKQMDFMVSSAMGHSLSHENSGTAHPVPLSNRPCRYGANCSRPGCRFRHPDDGPNRSQTSPIPSAPSGPRPQHLYGQHPWLPHEITARISASGQLTIHRSDANGFSVKSGIFGNPNHTNNSVPTENGSSMGDTSSLVESCRQYSLSAVVCYVDDVQRNIVSLVRIDNDELERVPENGLPQWYLFNDFCVTPVAASEVSWFNLEWKRPCVVFYKSEGGRGGESASRPTPPPAGHMFGSSGGGTATFTPLAHHEIPKQGELVGMDAEFVTLNQEEAELRSDGRMSTIRPSHLAVARITCVRGQGPLEGTPFIDDYISTQEQVVDYLTKFSGIKPGDLDANFSSKHLTTLKSTYQKLRCLVDTGVIFVGHGLKNDFRVINLVVPTEQVIDTVQLFHLPHHRMVSLKFLAWHLLDMKIQSETHDSAEDARAALQLYRRYLQLESAGAVAPALAKLYDTGKRMQWKVPDD